MSSKNNPLRVIDQKTVSETPQPGAQPVRYNPYTGGVIKQSTEARYKIFLEKGTRWTKLDFILRRKNSTPNRVIALSVRVPRLLLRIENPNVDIQKLKVFLSFERRMLDAYGDEDFNTANDSLPNIVAFTTQSVTHVGAVNKSVGNLDITSHVRRLFLQYSFYDLLTAVGVDVPEAILDTYPDDDLVGLFQDSMNFLRVYANAMFQPLDSEDISSTEFIFRMPVSCNYSLNPDEVARATITNFVVRRTPAGILISFSQVNMDSVEFTIHDTSSGSANDSNLIRTIRIKDFTTKDFSERINLSSLISFDEFNKPTNPLISAEYLLNVNTSITVRLVRTRTKAGVVYTGDAINLNYKEISKREFVFQLDNYNESPVLNRRPTINLINGSWNYYFYKTNRESSVGGILLIYTINTNAGIRYVPRFFSVNEVPTALPFNADSNIIYYDLTDPFTDNRANTFKIKFSSIINVAIRFVSVLGRVSTASAVFNWVTVNLNWRVENPAVFGGYYTVLFKRERNTVVPTVTIFNNSYLQGNSLYQITCDFKVIVEQKFGNFFKEIQRSKETYSINVIQSTGNTFVAIFEKGKPSAISTIPLGVTFKRTGSYRIKFEAVIPDKYSGYYNGGQNIYFLPEFKTI